jgi:hypothetical protein
MEDKTKLIFQCCFCGQSVDKLSPDFVEMAISLPEGGTQGLYAHSGCLKDKLHPSVPFESPEPR